MSEFAEIWFRGQGNVEHWPVPGVQRKSFLPWLDETLSEDDADLEKSLILNSERRLFTEFRRRGSSMLPSDANFVDAYFLAQHYKLPTRLLDWTENPLACFVFRRGR